MGVGVGRNNYLNKKKGHKGIAVTVDQQGFGRNKTKLLQTIDKLQKKLFKANNQVKYLAKNLNKSRMDGGG